MKKVFAVLNRKICLMFIIAACFIQSSLVFAQTQQNVEIAGCDIESPCALQAGTVVNMLHAIYCCSMKFVVQQLLHYEDLQFTNVIDINNKLLTNEEQAKNATNSSLSNFISYYFSDKKTRDMATFTTASLKAEDDSGEASKFDITFLSRISPLFSRGAKSPEKIAALFFNQLFDVQPSNKKPEYAINNEMFSINNLLGPTQYNDEQKFYAEAFIQYLENISPAPDIIRVSENFNIPYSPDTGKTSMNLQIKKDDATKIQTYLGQQPIYRKYKLGYRSQIAARTALIGNLLQSYQRRVAIKEEGAKGEGESAEQAAFNGANWRLQNSGKKDAYYYEMQKAPPATVARETLILLAEIHRDMYEIQKQNERLITLQSISGLQTMGFGDLLGDSEEKKIGQLIYCKYCALHSDGKYKDYDSDASKNTCGAAANKCKDIDLSKPIEAQETPDISKMLGQSGS